jgi:hypothetical protein
VRLELELGGGIWLDQQSAVDGRIVSSKPGKTILVYAIFESGETIIMSTRRYHQCGWEYECRVCRDA